MIGSHHRPYYSLRAPSSPLCARLTGLQACGHTSVSVSHTSAGAHGLPTHASTSGYKCVLRVSTQVSTLCNKLLTHCSISVRDNFSRLRVLLLKTYGKMLLLIHLFLEKLASFYLFFNYRSCKWSFQNNHKIIREDENWVAHSLLQWRWAARTLLQLYICSALPRLYVVCQTRLTALRHNLFLNTNTCKVFTLIDYFNIIWHSTL